MSWTRAGSIARGARHDLGEVLRDHAHPSLDFRQASLRHIERITVAQRLIDCAVADRKHDGRDEHRDDDFDECEATPSHQGTCGGVLTGGRGDLGERGCRPDLPALRQDCQDC
jgi:hypothetical protein